MALNTSDDQLAQLHLHGQIRIAVLAQRDEQVLVKIGGLVDRNVVRARDRHVNQLPLRVAQFPRRRLADAGERPGKVRVILHRHQPIERHHRQRRILAGLIAILLVRAARGGQRIDHALDAERTRLQQTDLFRLHVARLANAVAINGGHVRHAGRQPRTLFAVAENHRGLVVVVGLGDELAIFRTESGKRVRLVPLHVVDENFQRAVNAGRIRRGHECQRRLFERERLKRLAAIAVAERFVARLAVRGFDDVAVNRHRIALVGIGHRLGEAQISVQFVAGQGVVEAVVGTLQH